MFFLSKDITEYEKENLLRMYLRLRELHSDFCIDDMRTVMPDFPIIEQMSTDIADFFFCNSVPLLIFRNLPKIADLDFTIFLANLFGDPLQFDGEGDIVMRLTPNKNADKARPAFNNRLPFPLHTDLSYISSPPPYVMVRVAKRDINVGGTSLFAPIKNIIQRMTSKERDCLAEGNFSFKPPPHYTGAVAHNVPIIVLDTHDYRARFRQDGLEKLNPDQKAAVDRFARLASEIKQEIIFQEGDMCIIDNFRILHGRSAVVLNADRELHRVYLA